MNRLAGLVVAVVAAVIAGLAPLPLAQAQSGKIQPVPFKTPDKLADVLQSVYPQDVKLDGYLGQRVAANEKARLLVVNEEELLAGFRDPPGKQAWIGEHIGKFLHAATLAWANTGDEQLRAKIDRVAAELIKCQGADGYLGTYLPKDRWTSWDVWIHKYNMIGLLTHYQYTGNAASLEAARKMADLLVATFPSKMSIIKAGTHVGMAATSVLEPIVILYRFTGEEKYLDFAKYIVSAYDEPNGPRVIKSLVELKAVNKTANGKAYEMMSNLVGLCELARATGDKSLLAPCVNAWEDVVAHQLYVTGASSHGEHFGKDNDLPNNPKANIGETCVTVTWIQLNAQLLRLTGEAKYADEIERAYYNHLAAAQLPDGSKWCYYTALLGTKPYGNSTNCCLSSGPRGIAMAPQLALFTRSADAPAAPKTAATDPRGALVINSLDSFVASAKAGGATVIVESRSQFPKQGQATFTLKMPQPATFAVQVRAPAWARPLRCALGGMNLGDGAGGYLTIPARAWKDGDSFTIDFTLAPRVIVGDHTNTGYAALAWGPMILAYDAKRNPTLPANPAGIVLLEGQNATPLTIKPIADERLAFEAAVRVAEGAPPVRAVFVPFAEAGAEGSRFQVWMSLTHRPLNSSLLAPGMEDRSRRGNLDGSINDGDPDSVVVTFDGNRKDQDTYAITLADKPVTINRIVYVHGKTFHDGGWFDASAGKPRIQVQKSGKGAWETIGTLDGYPATTATDAKGLKGGESFTLKLSQASEVWGVRIIGTPACGDNPRQAFSSCAELQAYKD